MSTQTRMIDRSAIKHFVLAGNAMFTLRSRKTDKHYTFKVMQQQSWNAQPQQSEPVLPPSYIVKVLCGPDNSKNYRTIGRVYGEGCDQLKYLFNSQLPYKTFEAFTWFWRQLTERQGAKIDQCEFYHAGRCGRCGRLLTVPESVANGIGPECADRLAFEATGGAEGLLRQLL